MRDEYDVKTFFKKPRKNASQALRKLSWSIYIGPQIQETDCPLCGLNRINQHTATGFEGAHVVAAKYMQDDELNIFYIYPSCSSCNSICRDYCILDFLFCKGRLNALRKFIMDVFNAFLEKHQHELPVEEQMACKILNHLYGKKRFPSGGGLVNEKAIYEIARIEQYHVLMKKAAVLSAELEGIGKQMRTLTELEVKPFQF